MRTVGLSNQLSPSVSQLQKQFSEWAKTCLLGYEQHTVCTLYFQRIWHSHRIYKSLFTCFTTVLWAKNLSLESTLLSLPINVLYY